MQFNPNLPTGKLIEAALVRAREVAKHNEFSWKGESCGHVSWMGLMLVMWNRNLMKGMRRVWRVDGKGPITDDVDCIDLAYADHYLDRRTSCGYGMSSAFAKRESRVYGELKTRLANSRDEKRMDRVGRSVAGEYPSLLRPIVQVVATAMVPEVARVSRAIAHHLQENKCKPLSRPGSLQLQWANYGIKDGLQDYANNPESERDRPAWLNKVRRLAQIELPRECR